MDIYDAPLIWLPIFYLSYTDRIPIVENYIGNAFSEAGSRIFRPKIVDSEILQRELEDDIQDYYSLKLTLSGEEEDIEIARRFGSNMKSASKCAVENSEFFNGIKDELDGWDSKIYRWLEHNGKGHELYEMCKELEKSGPPGLQQSQKSV